MNFSVLGWNIQGTKNHHIGTNLKKVVSEMEKSKADIFCLQEAQELREKLAEFNGLREYNSIFPADKYDRNIILSKFPIACSGELIFPSITERPLEKVLWAEIKIGQGIIKVYNCHFEIVGVGPKQRVEQLKFVLEDSKKYSGPTIICGDFNTVTPPAGWRRRFMQWFHKMAKDSLILNGEYFRGDERYTFMEIIEQAGFREATDISRSTWCLKPFGWELFKLKLDWFLIRGLEIPQISMSNYISDHRSILAEFSIT